MVLILKKDKVIIALIIALLFKLAIDFSDWTSMVRSVTKVNHFTYKSHSWFYHPSSWQSRPVGLSRPGSDSSTI